MQIMGILNVTPDSFSDGGKHVEVEKALETAHAMIADGASIIDIGGESTRPGATSVSSQEEIDRVLPVIEGLAGCQATLSVDTQKPEVMEAAIRAGATLINDVNALQAPGALETVAKHPVQLCLMHKQGSPQTMQTKPQYDDVVDEVYTFLQARLQACEAAGIANERVILDPGFGFGKTLAHNYQLLNKLERFLELGCPLLIGCSRKSMFYEPFRLDVSERLVPSVSAVVIAALKGATLFRVHDVKATAQALGVVEMMHEHN